MKVSAQSNNNNNNGKKTVGKKCARNGSGKRKGAKQVAAKKKTMVKKKSITKTNKKTTAVKKTLKNASSGRKRTCGGKLFVQIEGLTKPQRRGEKGTTSEVVSTAEESDETTTTPQVADGTTTTLSGVCMFQNLPTELKERIYDEVVRKDPFFSFPSSFGRNLKHLACTSSTFSRELRPRLWKSITVGSTLQPQLFTLDFSTDPQILSKLKFLEYTTTLRCRLSCWGCGDKSDNGVKQMCKNIHVLIDNCPNVEAVTISDGAPLHSRRSVEASLTPHEFTAITKLPQLKTLQLSGFKIDTTLFSVICTDDLCNLKELYLQHTYLADPSMKYISKLLNLEKLVLSKSSITHVGFKRLNGLEQLKSINLFDSMRIKLIPVMNDVPALEELSVSGCKITDKALMNIVTSFPKLRSLCIDGCRMVTFLGLLFLCSRKSLLVLDCQFIPGVSREEVMEVKKLMPWCKVIYPGIDQRTEDY